MEKYQKRTWMESIHLDMKDKKSSTAAWKNLLFRDNLGLKETKSIKRMVTADGSLQWTNNKHTRTKWAGFLADKRGPNGFQKIFEPLRDLSSGFHKSSMKSLMNHLW